MSGLLLKCGAAASLALGPLAWGQQAANAPAPAAAAAPALPASTPSPAELLDLYAHKTGAADWSGFLADSGSGTVSAAGLLGLDGDAVNHPENVKDFIVSLKGLNGGDGKNAFALGITPARTALAPMNLSTYARGLPQRLLGSLTLGYAQGGTTVGGQTFRRRGWSAETTAFLNWRDDPVLAFAYALKTGTGDCKLITSLEPVPPFDPDGKPKPEGTPGAVPKSVDPEAVRESARKCRDSVKTRWNASKVYAAYAGGRIWPDTGGGPGYSLGRVLQLGFNYGFEAFAGWRDDASLTLAYRRSRSEPVLQSLVSGPVAMRDASFASLRFTYGVTKDVKVLAEASNQKDALPTSSETVFKRAVGIDYKLAEGWWLNLRSGRKQKVDGTGDESASLIGLSLSPTTSLLGPPAK